jgi:hypothetical protein
MQGIKEGKVRIDVRVSIEVEINERGRRSERMPARC